MPQHEFQNLAEHAFPRRTALWYYRLTNAVWLWICLAVVLGFFQWRINASEAQSAFDLQEHSKASLWLFHGLGLVAGVVLFAGIWIYLPRLEVVGHCLLTGFIALNATAVAQLQSVGIAFVITCSISLASLFRVLYLVKFNPELRHKASDGGMYYDGTTDQLRVNGGETDGGVRKRLRFRRRRG